MGCWLVAFDEFSALTRTVGDFGYLSITFPVVASPGNLEAANAWNLELNGRSSPLRRPRGGFHHTAVMAAYQFMNLVMNAIDVLCG